MVTAIGCVYPIPNGVTGNYVSLIPPTNAVLMPIGSNQTFNIPCYTNQTVGVTAVRWSGPIKGLYSGYIVVNYTNAYTHFNNTVYGSIRAVVSG